MTEMLLDQGNTVDPHKLSTQLLECLGNMPQSNTDDGLVRASFCDPETFIRRGASEHKRILCGRVTSIVDQAPVTASYKAQVISQFEIVYVLGVNSRGEAFSQTGGELHDFERLVGCDPDGDMAIFFEDGGRQERSAYLQTFARYLQILSATYEYDPNRVLGIKGQLQQWGEELTARYQRSPIPHHIYDILEGRKSPSSSRFGIDTHNPLLIEQT